MRCECDLAPEVAGVTFLPVTEIGVLAANTLFAGLLVVQPFDGMTATG